VSGRFSMGRVVVVFGLKGDRGGCCTCTDDIWTGFDVMMIGGGAVEELVEKDGSPTAGIDDECESGIGRMGTLVGGITLELESWESECDEAGVVTIPPLVEL